MNFKILKKDFKRKKSMNVILLIFILLASMFSSSSLNNMIATMRGTNYFFEKAGVEDFFILTMRDSFHTDDLNEQNTDNFLDFEKSVLSYSKDGCMYFTKSNISLKGKDEMEVKSTMLFSKCVIEQQKFFDENNHEITDMEDGSIYIPFGIMKSNDIKKGDQLIVSSSNGYTKEFTVAGYQKDALMGADMMGAHRCLLSAHDFNEMANESNLPYGVVYSVKSDDIKQLKMAYNEQNLSAVFSADQDLIKTTYLMDLIFAAVLLMVSVCLILISIVMLRFLITFTINEDYKEIGIMKAIGIKEQAIRKLYVSKYLVLACMGSFIGFISGIPFNQFLTKQISQNIVIGDFESGIVIQVIASIVIVLVICFFAYLCTRRVKKLSPMDAIRNGNNGERFKKKGVFHIHKSRMRATTFLACNDVLSELKKYIIVLITSVIGIWLIVMPLNTINTLRSEKTLLMFGMQPCDIWLNDDAKITDLIVNRDRQQYDDYLREVKENLISHDIPAENIFMETYFHYKIRKGDTSSLVMGMQGIQADITKYLYEEGSAPKYENEIAIAYVTAKTIDAKVGDTVYIIMNGEEKSFIVSALYQSMNNMGEGLRFNDLTEMDYNLMMGGSGAEIMLEDGFTQEEYDTYFEKIRELYPIAQIQTSQQAADDMIGSIASRLDDLKILILALVIAVNVLVVVLMQKMFLVREKGEMAMMKSVGFSNGAIIRWQSKRIALVLFVGVALGVLTGTPFSRITSGQVFKMMGASRIEFIIKPMEVYVIYPVSVFLATLLACVVTMRKVRNIKVQEINNID